VVPTICWLVTLHDFGKRDWRFQVNASAQAERLGDRMRISGIVRTTMNAIKIDTTISEAVARAIPALRPLLGKRVELIALAAAPPQERVLTVDEFLAARIELPAGSSPITLEDMERAIAEGALGR